MGDLEFWLENWEVQYALHYFVYYIVRHARRILNLFYSTVTASMLTSQIGTVQLLEFSFHITQAESGGRINSKKIATSRSREFKFVI
jgi:hypothetical protein